MRFLKNSSSGCFVFFFSFLFLALSLVCAQQEDIYDLLARLEGDGQDIEPEFLNDIEKACRPAVNLLVAELVDKDSPVRIGAAKALGYLKESSALGPLLDVLNDEDDDWEVRGEAALALGSFGDVRALESLLNALQDEDEVVRWDAADALGKIRDIRAVGPLIEALEDEEEIVRWEAAESLGELGDKRAIEPLITCLEDENGDVQSMALEALALLGDLSELERPLVKALMDKEVVIRDEIAELLLQLEWEPDDETEEIALLIAESEWERCKEWGRRAVEQLILALDFRSINRMMVIGLLGEIGDSSAIPALAERLPDRYYGQEIADALAQLGWAPQSFKEEVHLFASTNNISALKEKWEECKAILLEDLTSNNFRTIRCAAGGILDVEGKEAVPDLIHLLERKGNKMMACSFSMMRYEELRDASYAWLLQNCGSDEKDEEEDEDGIVENADDEDDERSMPSIDVLCSSFK